MVDILAETPATPPECQWALFLRNHDELTLEMVTDEERDYMYRAYAQDPQARVNVGIRRRLAPLLGNDRKLMEMMNGLLFSMPGTPIIYYGDEIGMGDNIYLGDRNAVRTPMQWNSDRNAGFSAANPQRLYLPVIIDPEYHSQAVNVEAQQENPNSLLWWMKRLIALRQRYRAFGRGTLEVLRPDNRKVFAFIRRFEDERILVVVNLSRNVQCVELDLSEFRGATPIELFGNSEFPSVGDLPVLHHARPARLLLVLARARARRVRAARPSFEVPGSGTICSAAGAARVRDVPPGLPRHSAAGSPRRPGPSPRPRVVDYVPLPPFRARRSEPVAHLCSSSRSSWTTAAPSATRCRSPLPRGAEAEELKKWHAEAVVADLRATASDGVLYDAIFEPAFTKVMVELLARRRSVGRGGGQAARPARLRRCASSTSSCPRTTRRCPSPPSSRTARSCSASSAIMKFIRRFEEGINPGVEVGRFLSERARFPYAPLSGGSVEYRPDAPGSVPTTVAVLEEFISNEDDGWNYVVDALIHSLEEALAHRQDAELRLAPPAQPLLPGARASSSPVTSGRRPPGVGVSAGSADGRAAPGPDLGPP